jgi:hypothetical protein
MTANKSDKTPNLYLADMTEADKAQLAALSATTNATLQSGSANASEASVAKVIAEDLFTALPRIGILVFIEIIALFFLKQYQAMREEYRYFEAIRRSREDAAFLLSYIEEKKIAVEFDKLMGMDSAAAPIRFNSCLVETRARVTLSGSAPLARTADQSAFTSAFVWLA